MADSRITDLTEHTAELADDDLLEVVDVSDTSLAATGTNKKIKSRRLNRCVTANCRLTLAPGNPVYQPWYTLTPSSTDTTAETVTFAAPHGWVSGTMVRVSATANGLTINTTYYVNAASTTAISFHTTLAAAMAGTSKVNLTGSITATVQAFGIQATSLYLSPCNGNKLPIYDGTVVTMREFSELTLALGTLTASTNYDVFVYDSSGTLTLILGPAWTGANARGTGAGTTELSRTAGLLLNANNISGGPNASRGTYVGTLRTISTTEVELSFGNTTNPTATPGYGGKLFLWNAYNQVTTTALFNGTNSHTYGTASWRQWEASSAAQCEIVIGLPAVAHGAAGGEINMGTDNTAGYVAMGINKTSGATEPFFATNANNRGVIASNSGKIGLQQGYHYGAMLEYSGSATSAFANAYCELTVMA